MTGNGAIAGLVAITAPSGYVEYWAAPIIGFVAGMIVVVGVIAIDRKLDDPVGALSAHGLAGIWGTLACGLFTCPRLAELNAIGDGGLFYTGSFHQLGVQALGVAAAFASVFASQLPRLLRRSRRPTACAWRPRRSATASTSSSTACGATRSSSCRCRAPSTTRRRAAGLASAQATPVTMPVTHPTQEG